MKISSHKINIRTIRKLQENEGLTLKRGQIVNYKTGWQVAFDGIEAHTPEEVMEYIRKFRNTYRNMGVWYSQGVYYVDACTRVPTKKIAVSIGNQCNQISVFAWHERKREGQLLYL